MSLHLRHSSAVLAAVAVSLVCAATASAQWTISRPGSYKLYNNYRVASGHAIIITASNVTLDLNGFSATSSANATTTAPAPGPNGTRGITVQGARNVEIKNGHVAGFNSNVTVLDSQNVRVDGLQISGGNLAPAGGPTEVGTTVINSSACDILNNTISSVNLGLFVRGGSSGGGDNRRFRHNGRRDLLSGGPRSHTITADNLLGICYNPDGNPADSSGPRGDSIYNNHIARYGFAIAVSAGSVSNMFNDNTLASFTGAFREPTAFAAQGGTNVEFDNTAVLLPAPPVAPAP